MQGIQATSCELTIVAFASPTYYTAHSSRTAEKSPLHMLVPTTHQRTDEAASMMPQEKLALGNLKVRQQKEPQYRLSRTPNF